MIISLLSLIVQVDHHLFGWIFLFIYVQAELDFYGESYRKDSWKMNLMDQGQRNFPWILHA